MIATYTPSSWGERVQQSLAPGQRLWIAGQIAKVIQAAATAAAPLNFRGAIAEGQFLIDENLLLGQAVDGAAELMNVADAAVVWFSSRNRSGVGLNA